MKKDWLERALECADQISAEETKKRRCDIVAETIIRAALDEVGYKSAEVVDIRTGKPIMD